MGSLSDSRYQRQKTAATNLQRTCNEVVRETASAREWPGFPGAAVAIAGNGSGDQLILLPSAAESGILSEEVHWWDHETGDFQKVASRLEELISEIE